MPGFLPELPPFSWRASVLPRLLLGPTRRKGRSKCDVRRTDANADILALCALQLLLDDADWGEQVYKLLALETDRQGVKVSCPKRRSESQGVPSECRGTLRDEDGRYLVVSRKGELVPKSLFSERDACLIDDANTILERTPSTWLVTSLLDDAALEADSPERQFESLCEVFAHEAPEGCLACATGSKDDVVGTLGWRCLLPGRHGVGL